MVQKSKLCKIIALSQHVTQEVSVDSLKLTKYSLNAKSAKFDLKNMYIVS